MPEIEVRDVPARSLLRHASSQRDVWAMGKEVLAMLKAQPPPRVEGTAGAAFLIYYGEVSQDSDGPVEFCWPVPHDQAGQLAACTRVGHDATQAQWQAAADAALAWTAGQRRQVSDLGLRVTLLSPSR